MALPDATRLFTGHDYCPGSRAVGWESAVALQRAENEHLTETGTEVAFRANARGARLHAADPKLFLHAQQVNIRDGCLPEPEANGKRFLKRPLNALKGAAWGE